MQMKCQCEQYSHLIAWVLDLWIRSALSQGTFLKDALQAPVCQDTTLVPLLRLDQGHSSFTSSGKGSEVGGRFLCSLLFLKPWLQKQQKNPFHRVFFPGCSIVFVCIHNVPSLYRKKNLQWKREYLKNEKNPHTPLGEITKSFPSLIVAERCTCKVHLHVHGWLCLVKQGHVRGGILAVVKPVGFLPVILIRARISP